MQGELPVMQKQERISPLSRGSSHIFFCSSLPNMCSTSIFPVSVDRPDACPEHNRLNMTHNNRFLRPGCAKTNTTPARFGPVTDLRTHSEMLVVIKAGM